MNLVQILRGGSSYTRFLMRENSIHTVLDEAIPPGGGVSFDQSGPKIGPATGVTFVLKLFILKAPTDFFFFWF